MMKKFYIFSEKFCLSSDKNSGNFRLITLKSSKIVLLTASRISGSSLRTAEIMRIEFSGIFFSSSVFVLAFVEAIMSNTVSMNNLRFSISSPFIRRIKKFAFFFKFIQHDKRLSKQRPRKHIVLHYSVFKALYDKTFSCTIKQHSDD